MEDEKTLEEIRSKAEQSIEAVYEAFVENKLVPIELIDKIRSDDWEQIVSSHYPYSEKMSGKEYDRDKKKLQIDSLSCKCH